jgi:hypothetical protein
LKKRRLIPPALRKPRLTGGKNGAPFGNAHALKHGRRTRELRALKAAIRAHTRRARELIASLADPPSLHPSPDTG